MIGCQKNHGTVTANPWRLVKTSDPDLQSNVTCFTFLIFTFNLNMTGDVKLVQNNTQYEAPVRTFVYSVDTASETIRIKYAYPGDASANGASTQSGSGDAPVDYGYNIQTKKLQLVEPSGANMDFVPFTGIIAPDDSKTCEKLMQ
jgi:hypothetical protein